ncbi:MAG: ribosomal protein S18-alanine N-acetyltransferase [Clostridia bacterium]|nr:ribosomal protein S18-alanine N-acetyltransferase [Clostridia bacterium]
MTFTSLSVELVDCIVQLQNSCFPDGWDKKMLLDGLNNGLLGIVAIDNDEILGFITYSKNIDFAEINDILVAPAFRRQGLAKQLLNRIELLLKEKTQKIFLEVRESNFPAINLYKSAGFKQISVRKKYYSDGENALVMQKEL